MAFLKAVPLLLLSLLCFRLEAAEKVFDFSAVPQNQSPPGFRNAVSDGGKPGEWQVVWDDAAPLMEAASPQPNVFTKRAVLAQLSRDSTDEHFPLFIYQGETYADFTLRARVKMMEGNKEQMAGLAFRIQNETNYYVLRASALGNTLKFYKVVNGQRGDIIGPSIAIPARTWHEIAVECKGNQIRCFLNGKQAIPVISDDSFAKGKIGFWTKSDSVSYFADAKIVYTPWEAPAQKIVRDVLQEYPRLLGIRIYVGSQDGGSTRLIAAEQSAQAQIGTPGQKTDLEVLKTGGIAYGKTGKTVLVTMPLRDRNGDIVAAAKIIMKTFPGQTEKNAVERAAPLVRQIQTRVQALQDLVD